MKAGRNDGLNSIQTEKTEVKLSLFTDDKIINREKKERNDLHSQMA